MNRTMQRVLDSFFLKAIIEKTVLREAHTNEEIGNDIKAIIKAITKAPCASTKILEMIIAKSSATGTMKHAAE